MDDEVAQNSPKNYLITTVSLPRGTVDFNRQEAVVFGRGSDIVYAWLNCYPETAMKKQLRIILYGDTLVLAGMRLSLEANPAFKVIPFGGADAAEQELLALQPDVVIFDTSSIQPNFHYEPLGSSLQLIGIDPDRDQALVWSGQHLNDLSVQDLVEILEERHGDGEKRG